MRVFAGATCFLALIQVFCIAFGLARVGMNRPLAVGITIASAGMALAFASRFRSSQPGKMDPGRGRLGAVPVMAVLMFAWTAWVWIQLWVLASYRPVYDWDGLTYHIPAIHEWTRLGHVAFIRNLPDLPVVNYPMGVELTSFWSSILLGTSRLVDACNLWYWPLAVTALVVTAGVLGARGASMWLAGALFVGASVFVSQSVTAYVDPGFASTVIASIAGAAVFVFGARRNMKWKGILFGAALGLMLGSKGYGLPFFLIVLATTVVARLRIGGREGLRRDGGPLGWAIAVAVMVGAYWYVRNAITAGNPVYPIALTVGEKVLIPGWDHTYFASVDIPTWLARYPGWSRPILAWLQLDAPIHGYGWSAGGLGFIWIAAAVPAVVVLWFRAARRGGSVRVGPLAFLTVTVGLLFVTVDARWWARQTLWLHALGLPAFAALVSGASTGKQSDAARFVIMGLVVGTCGLAVWESSRTLSLEWQTGRDPASTRRTTFLPTERQLFSGLRSAPYFDQLLAADQIGRGRWATAHGQLLGGILSLPLGRRQIHVVPSESDGFRDPYAALTERPDPRPGDLAALESRGVRLFIWDDPGTNGPSEDVLSRARGHGTFDLSPTSRLHVLRLQDGRDRMPNGTTR